MFVNLRLIVLIYQFLLIDKVINSKLNVPRVLLPIFNDISTKFTLEATEGDCYKWTTSRSDIIKLVPYDTDFELDCSSKVIVFTNTKERTRSMAVVLAEDFYTNQVLRCDVIVDIIDSLAVITTTRELYVEEAPEAFEVRAYDSQGNEFTTLEGIEFDWNIVGLNKFTTIGIRFMTFKDSPYETPLTIENFENENKKGHIVLLSGIKTGSAKVSVKLPHSEYKDIEGHSVNLSIIANLIITPAEVYLMVGDTVPLNVIQMNNGRMIKIDLSLSEYFLNVETRQVASIDPLGYVTGLVEGKTKITLFNTNAEEYENGKFPTSIVNVVTPAHMTLTILPYNNWAILLSEHHNIVADVYSRDDHKLYLGDNVKNNIEIDGLFHVQERSDNGTWLTGWATEEGNAPVLSTLEGVVNTKLGTFKLTTKISANAELLVFPHIILNPSEVILPWDPILKPKYEIEVKALGGDGNFFWSSSNQSIGIVTQLGFVRTHFHGHFEVSAAMIRNPHNKQSAIFHILPPSKIQIAEYIMEAEVGEPILLHIALFASKETKGERKNYYIPFTRCQELPFEIKVSNMHFIHNTSMVIDPVGISCATVAIVSHNVGVCKVTVTYNVNGTRLEDSVTISTFEPLRLLFPEQREIALAVDTSTYVIFAGGPRPFIGRPSVYKRDVVSQSITIVTALDITDKNPANRDDVILLIVSCLTIGSSNVRLSVSNSPLSPDSKNQETYLEVKVFCAQPYSISLHPVIKIANVHSCPMDTSANRIIVPSHNDIEVIVKVKDENDRTFFNISSLRLRWTIDPENLADIGSYNSVFTRHTTENNVVYANGSYQVITPKSNTGILKLSVAILGYLKEKRSSVDILQCLSRDNVDKLNCIRDEIYLYLANEAVVSPNKISVYNHPSNKKRITVDHGSGYYEVALSSEDIALVRYIETSRQLEVTPMKEGKLEVTLTDLCLSSSPAIVTVSVVSINSIKVEMSDKVEIGKSISAIVTLYDESDNLLSIPELGTLTLSAQLDIKIVKVKQVEDEDLTTEELHYIITGTELGNTKLKFVIGDIVSPAVDLQVFPPLKVIPQNTTLLIGTMFQYTSRGGPQPDNIEYNVINKTVADITSVGLVQTLSLGYSKVEAYSVSVNPTTGLKIVYSQDEIDLHVIAMNGIKIMTALTRFQVGTTMPIWATGLPEQLSPMILGSAQKPFKFHWRVDDGDIIKIQGSFSQYGVEYLPENEVCAHLLGLSNGRTTVYLDVTLPESASSSQKVFSDSIDIEVFEDLVLTTSNTVNGKFIIMAAHSTLQLETNLDGLKILKYTLPSAGPAVVNDKTNNKQSLSIPNPLLTVSDTGLVQSYSTFGVRHVVITAIDALGLKQTLNLVIEVKPVHFMLLNVVTNWHVNSLSPIRTIPLGTEFQLQASFHDNTGVKFNAANFKLGIRSTRTDLINIRPGPTNSSVIVSTKKSGDTILRGFSAGLQKNADYIKLHVGQVLSLMDENVTTGDVICPWTPLVTLNKDMGSWSTSDNSLVTIDAHTGIGHVTGTRSGQVTVTHLLHPSSALHLTVVPATEIIMHPNAHEVLTNAPETTYKVPLVITANGSSSKKSNLVYGWQCQHLLKERVTFPFMCYFNYKAGIHNLDINNLFNIRSGFDLSTGQYTCELLTKNEYSPNIHYSLGNVSVWANLIDGGIKADPVVIPFVPAVSVSPELVLKGSQLKGDLVIKGVDFVLDQVEVHAVDKQILHVHAARRSENMLTYKINLLNYHNKLDRLSDAVLVITSPVTNQMMKVHVSVDESGTDDASFYHSPFINLAYTYRHSVMFFGTAFLLFVVTVSIYSHFIQPVINVNTSPYNNSNLSFANAAPSSSSTAYSRSSRSPNQPTPRCLSYGNNEPVYGDPNTFYCSSPELRRNRQFI